MSEWEREREKRKGLKTFLPLRAKRRTTRIAFLSARGAERTNLALRFRLLPAIFGFETLPSPTPLPQRASAQVSARHARQKRIKIAEGAVSERDGERGSLPPSLLFFPFFFFTVSTTRENRNLPLLLSLCPIPALRRLDRQSDAPDRASATSRRCWRRAGAARARGFGGRKRESSRGGAQLAGEASKKKEEETKLFFPPRDFTRDPWALPRLEAARLCSSSQDSKRSLRRR